MRYGIATASLDEYSDPRVAVDLARAAEEADWGAFFVWEHYAVQGVSLAPRPVQHPRIPIWIGGEDAPALRRGARWDGWLAPATSYDGTPTMAKSPERIAEMVAEIRRHRTTKGPFEVAIDGYSEAGDPVETMERVRVDPPVSLLTHRTARGEVGCAR
jgi:alkanesulfonate monooxygenase SsuD/methylene tetrahydromethanopterin reductase-like flavin-dependent oxidoreductase (luciferase family)